MSKAEMMAALEEMDAEMELLGIEDATSWEGFGEYEKILYALAEMEVFGRY